LARSQAYVVPLAGLPIIPFLDDLLDEGEKFFRNPVRSNMRKTLRKGEPVSLGKIPPEIRASPYTWAGKGFLEFSALVL